MTPDGISLRTGGVSKRLMIDEDHDDAAVEARLSELDELSDDQADPSDFEEALDPRSVFLKKIALRGKDSVQVLGGKNGWNIGPVSNLPGFQQEIFSRP